MQNKKPRTEEARCAAGKESRNYSNIGNKTVLNPRSRLFVSSVQGETFYERASVPRAVLTDRSVPGSGETGVLAPPCPGGPGVSTPPGGG